MRVLLCLRPALSAALGSVLLTIIPDGAKLQVELYVPTTAIAYVGQDDRVSMKYRAFPYQRFGMFKGRVVEIARSVVSATEVPQELNPSNEPMFRVLLEPASQEVDVNNRIVSLQSGMVVDVNVLTQRRAIWEWMVEPFIRRTAKDI